jgi:hypothetical protein
MKYYKLPLPHTQRIENYLINNSQSDAIYLKIPNLRIQKLFGGNPAHFFRMLKNGLHSFGGVSNRLFYKGLSGIYFSKSKLDTLEMVIIYEGTYPHQETKHRIKKLLGIDVELEFGKAETFKSKIEEILQVKTHTQFFGNAFFEKATS